MTARRKLWSVLIGTFLIMVISARSLGSLIPTQATATAAATPTSPATATVADTPTLDQGPMPGLVGNWLDPDTTGTVTTIAWQNKQYVVTSVSNPDRGGNEVTASNWSNGVLTWTYCVPNGACVTAQTVSVSGNSLETTWTNDQGYSGPTTLQRQP